MTTISPAAVVISASEMPLITAAEPPVPRTRSFWYSGLGVFRYSGMSV